MSSKIDPMVQELIDATRNATQAGGEDNEQWMNETAEHLTARLAQPTVTREDIHQAIWNLLNERGDEDDGVGASEITNAVMAVIAPDTAGGE